MSPTNTTLIISSLVLFAGLGLGSGCGGSQAAEDTAAGQPAEPSEPDDTSQSDQVDSPTATEHEASPVEQLVEERCAGCHDLDTVYSESLTRDQWLEEVNLMVSRGARLSEEERDVVVEFLASR